MDDYEFQSHWTPIAVGFPARGSRCIATDGDTIVIGTYVDDGVWVLDGIGQGCDEYNVIGWMPVPKPIKKTVPFNNNEDNVAKN